MVKPPHKQAPAAPVGAAENALAGIGRSLDVALEPLRVLDAIPGLSAITAIISLYSLFSGGRDQAMAGAIADIAARLTEIDRHVTEILTTVRRIPELINHALDDNRKRDLVNQVQTAGQAFSGTLAHYAGQSVAQMRANLDPRHATSLQQGAERMVDLVRQLAEWGPDSYPVIGQACASYIISHYLTGYSAQDVGFVRVGLLKQAVNAHNLINKILWTKSALSASERALLNSAAPRDVWLNCWPEPDGRGQVYYRDNGGSIAGNVDIGFSVHFIEEHTKQRPNEARRPVLGSGFPAQPVDAFAFERHEDPLNRYIAHLNDRATAVRQMEADTAETQKLAVASQSLMLAMASPLEATTIERQTKPRLLNKSGALAATSTAILDRARITFLERRGAERIAIVTDRNGTTIRNDPDDGTSIATFGDDRHDEEVAEYERGGWIVVP